MAKLSRSTIITIFLGIVMLAAGGFYFLKKSTVTPLLSSTTRRPNTSLPNIVFIIADDIGWNHYSFQHHPVIQTPYIDQLAHEGVVFNNGYSTNSICRPSLASLITGLYPYQHGITVNARIINKQRGTFDWGLPPYASHMNKLDTLPKQLAKLGYRSLQTGKWWEEGFANGGFDEGDKKPEGLLRHVTRRNVIGREGLEPVFSFIDANKQQPFFIWYAPQMPHVPYNPPEKFLAPYLDKSSLDKSSLDKSSLDKSSLDKKSLDKTSPNKTSDETLAKYFGMVSWFDDTIGQIIQHLEQNGLRENTIIIYLADNGVSLTSDLQEDESHRGKDSPYEMGIRTPIIFNWPGHWQTAERKDLVSSIDVFPTLMDLLQKPVTTLPGISLLPTIRDGVTPARTEVAGESYVDNGEERDDNPLAFRWIRSRTTDGADWKMITFSDGRIELFNLANDPDERHNLVTETANTTLHQQLLLKLQQMLPN